LKELHNDAVTYDLFFSHHEPIAEHHVRINSRYDDDDDDEGMYRHSQHIPIEGQYYTVIYLVYHTIYCVFRGFVSDPDKITVQLKCLMLCWTGFGKKKKKKKIVLLNNMRQFLVCQDNSSRIHDF
jgi:hypothetical protein